MYWDPATSARSSLSNLPGNLILQIFNSLEKTSDIAVLNRASRKLYIIWRMHAASIWSAVIPREVTRYEVAYELLEAHQKPTVLDEEYSARRQRRLEVEKVLRGSPVGFWA